MRRLARLIAAATIASTGGALAAERPRPDATIPSRACSHHGAGYVEVPGTATCIRIGGRVRAEAGAASGRRTISRDEIMAGGASGTLTADVRTETGAGPLRAYVRTRAVSAPYGW